MYRHDSEPAVTTSRNVPVTTVADNNGSKGGRDVGDSGNEGMMLLDDTNTTTYVHDLTREVADIENNEFWLSLTPVADELIRIPKTILADPRPPGKELVLYQDPGSLTVPKQQDNVKRAIKEYKERVRGKQGGSALQRATQNPEVSGSDRDRSHGEDDMDVD